MALFSTRFLPLLVASLVVVSVTAQSTSLSATSPATSPTPTPTPTPTASATIYPGSSSWTYYGCYNGTTFFNGTGGLRALNGGAQEALDNMTVPVCLTFCASNLFAFAGLEYTRECYCAQYLSALSTKLPDPSCDLPCEGNSSQICGGASALTVYNSNSSTMDAGATTRDAPVVGSILALGIAVGFLVGLA